MLFIQVTLKSICSRIFSHRTETIHPNRGFAASVRIAAGKLRVHRRRRKAILVDHLAAMRAWSVRFVPILLQKSFCGMGLKFSEP
jgi:hypothetical protein